jgi:hypothetical protein
MTIPASRMFASLLVLIPVLVPCVQPHGIAAQQPIRLCPNPGPLQVVRQADKEQVADKEQEERLVNVEKQVMIDFADAFVRHLALSPDGKLLAFACCPPPRGGPPLKPRDYEQWVVLVDATTGKQVHRISRDDGFPTEQLLFSPDSRYLLVKSNLRAGRLFDLDKKKFVVTYKGSEKMGLGPFSPDNKYLLGKSARGNALFWDVRTGKQLYECENPFGEIRSLTFSDDSRYFATRHVLLLNEGMKNELGLWRISVQMWQVSDGKHVCALGPDLERLEGTPEDKKLEETGVVVSGFRVREGPGGTFVAFPPPSSAVLKASTHPLRVASADEKGEWQKALSRAGCKCRLSSFRVTPDGNTLLACGFYEGDSGPPAIVVMRRAAASAKQPSPSASEVEKRFEQLAVSDAARAHEAASYLVQFPKETIAFFKEHLHPIPRNDPDAIAGLLNRLNHDDFAVRETAEQDLLAHCEVVIPVLKKCLAADPPPEVRMRVKRLLEVLAPNGRPSAIILQRLWAIEVLENLGTPEAMEILRTLSKGHPDACQTKEAKLSLERLTQQQKELAPQK